MGLRAAFAAMALYASAAVAQDPQTEAQEWFREARFGMFIHWGVYSLLGKGEWVMENDRMTVEEYEKLPSRFDPVDYDPAEWVRIAKDAGMRYITITSKHHDGFAMWDSKVSDYDIVERTPYGKDVLKTLAEECRKAGLKLFLYHSHLDWHHFDYYPRGKTGRHAGRPESGSFDAYLEYMNAQVAELAGGDYGELGGFWFDGWWDQHVNEADKNDRSTHVDWKLEETYDLIHRLQPGALIGNNHHVAPFEGEGFQMFERDLPGANTFGYNTTEVGTLPLETCDTTNGSWGFNASDRDFKSTKDLVHYLVRAAGHDANLLLNVGPTPEGTIPSEAVDRLREIGVWTRTFGETIYGTRGGPMRPQSWGVATSRDGVVYVHVLSADAPERLVLPGTADLALKDARLFGSGRAIGFTRQPDIVLQLPPDDRNPIDTIVVLRPTR
ncbi:MAG TPA: alpha-L-fucosidase [Vicinamibacteria bacterium]|nr:alpha-L-fucosidase [Vicinamibacteria bacterium]